MPFAQELTLTANTVATFTLDQAYEQAQIIARDGSAEVYYTSDGSTPVVGSGDVLPAAIGSVTINWGNTAEQEPGSTLPTRVIKVISSGTPKIAVEAGVT